MRLKKKTAEEDDTSNISSFKVIKELFSFIGQSNKKLISILVIIIIINVIVNWFTPLTFGALVDDGLGGGLGSIGGDIEVVLSLGTLFFFLTIIGVLTRIIQGYIISKLATLTMYHLRYELFVKFQALGLDYHDSPKRTTGKKINYLTGDVNTIQQLIQSGLLISLPNVFLVFGSLFFMILLSPELTLVAFLIVPGFFGIAGILFRKARKYYKDLRERVADVTSILDESIMGMKVIKSYAVEEENYIEFVKATEEERKTTMKTAKLNAFIPGTIILVITIGIGLLLLASGALIRAGSLTQGTLISFIFYIFMFFEPLFSLISFVTMLQNSIAAGRRIISLLNEEISILDDKNSIKITDIEGKVEYQDVNFSYDIDNLVLKDITLTLRENERLAIVGYTGAGKSTFIKLLSRFYDPTKGIIKIDDINLKKIEIESLRKMMGIVLQDNFLFSGTVKDNIRYGKLNATDQEIIEAAKKVNANEFIVNLESGYDTVVGERGNKLSEGQRQLIAFARAIISDPPILILDEATSSIDPYSELLIQKALETLLKGRTSISIAHRLSTIINSDRIVVLNKGRIIEEGTHQELVKLNGLYNHLYKMQFKDPYKKEEIEEEEVFQLDNIDDKFDKESRFPRFF
ncbi:MAG: ABC transporter ATP-binding protein [Promethearchaeota archaeon]|nr:MAG: ABC transporter ATP-binding protein [Candidatus Lokiarchaeota archaeon]